MSLGLKNLANLTRDEVSRNDILLVVIQREV
jgi:hypothetical protein